MKSLKGANYQQSFYEDVKELQPIARVASVMVNEEKRSDMSGEEKKFEKAVETKAEDA